MAPDPVIMATFQPHFIYHFIAPFLWAGVLIMIGCLAHAVHRMAPYRYGTVRYILELEQLVDTTARRRQNVLFVCMWLFMCFWFYVISSLTGASSGGVFLVTASLVFLANAIGAYNLVTEATPITPDMVRACPDDLIIPLSWHTPTTLTVAQVWALGQSADSLAALSDVRCHACILAQLFAVILVPFKALRRAKERPDGLTDLADHLDTRIIQHLPLKDLQRIRAMWVPHETVAVAAEGQQPALVTAPSTRKKTKRTPKPPPPPQGPRHRMLTPILRCLHLCISLKEHWILWLSMLSAANSLLGIAAPRWSRAANCLCTCESQTDTPFQDCYAQAVSMFR
jgi:hypothetical protein